MSVSSDHTCPECGEFIGLPQHHKYSCKHWNYIPDPMEQHRCHRCGGSGHNHLDGECLACDGTGFKQSNGKEPFPSYLV